LDEKDDASAINQPSKKILPDLGLDYEYPWVPVQNRWDFEVIEHCITNHLTPEKIDAFLEGVHGGLNSAVGRKHRSGYQVPYQWHTGTSQVTLQTSKDLFAILEKARKYVLNVSSSLLLQRELDLIMRYSGTISSSTPCFPLAQYLSSSSGGSPFNLSKIFSPTRHYSLSLTFTPAKNTYTILPKTLLSALSMSHGLPMNGGTIWYALFVVS
jgi:hypothetical protein